MPESKTMPHSNYLTTARVIREIHRTERGEQLLFNYPDKHKEEIPEGFSAKDAKDSSQLLEPVEELFIAGGGGAGRTLPGALIEARKYGLDLEKIKVVCGTSVGTIMALGITVNIPIEEMSKILDEMPTEDFQDWSLLESAMNFSERWGWCKGEAMPQYFKEMIHERTGIWDPTFQELYDAGYHKELRVVTTNLDKGDVTVFSYKSTPHKKVADAVALSCSVPILFPPKWLVSPEGKRELHTDGGVIKNYPFGVGSDASVPLEKQLGFIFVNGATAKKLNGQQKPAIQSFIQYLAALLSAIVFQHPLTLPEPVKQRTVAVRVNHNPFKFTASAQEQATLDQAGAMGVRSLISQMLTRQRDNYHVALRQAVHEQKRAKAGIVQSRKQTPSPSINAPLLPQYNQHKSPASYPSVYGQKAEKRKHRTNRI